MRSIPSSKAVWLSFLVLLVGLGAEPALAQSQTGTVTGTVLDVTNAVVPEADVTLTSETAGTSRRTKSNAEGFFTIASVAAGSYLLSVEAPGMSRWERKGVVVHPADRINVSDIRLAPAGTTEQITVSVAAPGLTPVDSGEKSALITGEQLQNIAIVGRNAAELLKILPGVVTITRNQTPGFTGEVIGINGAGENDRSQSPIGDSVINGSRPEAVDIVVDGAHSSDPGCNCATPVNANPDMIAEFKVMQSNFSAENAKGPVVMNVIGKAGGRDFHGTASITARHHKLNANDWQLNRAGVEEPKSEFYYPGFTLSGPLLIPGTDFNKDRSKVFFFLGFENDRQKLDTGVVRSIVPTARMLNGDFSEAPLFGPDAGQVNRIPTGPLVPDPGGRILLDTLFPDPTHARPIDGFNYIGATTADQNMTQLLGRVDWSVSDDTNVYVRYNRQREEQPFTISLWWRNGQQQLPYPSRIIGDNASDSMTGSLTHVFNPTMTSETVFAATRVEFRNRFENPDAVDLTRIGGGAYPYGNVFDQTRQIPSFGFGWGPRDPLVFAPGGFELEGESLTAKSWQLSAATNLTKIAGTHTLKVGAFFERVTQSQPGSEWSNGLLQYDANSSASTGNVFADLYTGVIGGHYEESSANVLRTFAFNVIEGYVQDSWKATARLTLEGGVRLSHIGHREDRDGVGVPVFDPALYAQQAADLNNPLPGVRWHQQDPSVPLSGIESPGLLAAPRMGFAYDFAGDGNTVIRGGYGIFKYQSTVHPVAFTVDAVKGRRQFSTGAATTLAAISTADSSASGVAGSGAFLDANDDKIPTTQSWSLTVQRRLPGSMAVELGYVGNKSDDLWNRVNNNDSSTGVNLQMSDVNFAPVDPETLQVTGPVPYPRYGRLSVYSHTLFQNYHGLQALLSRQRGRFNFMAAYTFSKALGVRGSGYDRLQSSLLGAAATPALPLRLANYGILGYDRTHVFTFSYNLTLPELKESAAFARALLGGWQFSGISTAISGQPLQGLQGSSINFGLGGGALGGGAVPRMPVITCDPTQRRDDTYLFDPSCFRAPEEGEVNGNYIFPYLRGPMYHNHDVSLMKNFAIGRDDKLQFRISAYNFLNHPLSRVDPSRTLSINSAEFGVLPDNDKVGRRIVQVAVKFFF